MLRIRGYCGVLDTKVITVGKRRFFKLNTIVHNRRCQGSKTYIRSTTPPVFLLWKNVHSALYLSFVHLIHSYEGMNPTFPRQQQSCMFHFNTRPGHENCGGRQSQANGILVIIYILEASTNNEFNWWKVATFHKMHQWPTAMDVDRKRYKRKTERLSPNKNISFCPKDSLS